MTKQQAAAEFVSFYRWCYALFNMASYEIITVRLDRPVENANRDALPHPSSRNTARGVYGKAHQG